MYLSVFVINVVSNRIYVQIYLIKSTPHFSFSIIASIVRKGGFIEEYPANCHSFDTKSSVIHESLSGDKILKYFKLKDLAKKLYKILKLHKLLL